MTILETTTHLIIITIKSYTYAVNERSIIIIMDLFNFNVVLIKMLNTTNNVEINKTIINFYNLYTKNYEFLTDLKKDLAKTSVLFLNFNDAILIPFNKPQEWWNEKQELMGLESMALIDNPNLLIADPNNTIKDFKSYQTVIVNKFTWGDIPQYIRYNIFLCLFDIINKMHKNKSVLTNLDVTTFV